MKKEIIADIQTVNYNKIEIIEDNWQHFSWKIDYLLYIFFTNNKPSDIIIEINESDNFITSITIEGLESYTIQMNNLKIDKDELFTSLNYNSSKNFQAFTYKTVIFNNNLLFRVQSTKMTTGELLELRFLNTGTKIDLIFNEKIEKFQQYYLLNEKFSIKNTNEKMKKI